MSGRRPGFPSSRKSWLYDRRVLLQGISLIQRAAHAFRCVGRFRSDLMAAYGSHIECSTRLPGRRSGLLGLRRCCLLLRLRFGKQPLRSEHAKREQQQRRDEFAGREIHVGSLTGCWLAAAHSAPPDGHDHHGATRPGCGRVMTLPGAYRAMSLAIIQRQCASLSRSRQCARAARHHDGPLSFLVVIRRTAASQAGRCPVRLAR